MELNTILQVLFANNQEDLVALAVKIDNKIETEIPIQLPVRCGLQDILPPMKFSLKNKISDSGYIMCKVINRNPYKLKSNYTVELPNGNLRQGVDDISRNGYKEEISELVMENIKDSLTDES